MKKLLFSAILLLAVAKMASAQCTPGPYTSPGIYPDTVVNLPPAYVNFLYNATITAVVPTDTVVSGFTMPIDSIGVTGWTGYPAGFIYTPNTASGFWAGGTSGCVLISGTPTIADTGYYYLVFNVDAYIMSSPSPMSYTKTGFIIHVKDTALNVTDNKTSEFALMQNSPNPLMNWTKIDFTSPTSQTLQFAVTNVIGEEVYKRTINATAGINTIEFSASNIPSGIYMYKLSSKTATLTKRMIIEK